MYHAQLTHIKQRQATNHVTRVQHTQQQEKCYKFCAYACICANTRKAVNLTTEDVDVEDSRLFKCQCNPGLW